MIGIYHGWIIWKQGISISQDYKETQKYKRRVIELNKGNMEYNNSDIAKFADKYIDFFEKEFGRTTESYYRFFDNNDFPNDCQEIGFQCLKDNIEKINDIQIIGNALFSQWRNFNHWSSPSYANEDTKEWFLILFRKLKDLC